MTKTYTITLHSHRATNPVKGTLVLTIKAESAEEANDLARDSVPGFDWARWESSFGITEIEK